ncbi:MAG: cytochrome c oxidase cbb3-type subunit 1 [Limisphaerales bacterium]|jgi:cytochrome c oxidase cbb3-type subunit 1
MSDSSFEIDYSPKPSTLDEVEASLRLPVLHSVLAAAFWLVVGSALLLVSTIQLTGSGLFADSGFLTYGKTKPAAWIALLYGFALQMGIAVALFVVCRRSKKALRHPFTVFVASKFWNLGVVLGIVGVYLGHSTGHRLFELPVYSSSVLFMAFAVIALKLMLVLHYRVERQMYIGQLYMGAAMFWFLWALSTAIILLQICPVPGAVQLVVDNWYINAVFQVVLGCFGLGALCYFLPQQSGRPLFSQELATAAFWMLVFIGGWTGLAGRWPLPVWISSVSVSAGFMMIVPVVAVVWNLLKSIQTKDLPGNNTLKFLVGGLFAYLVWSLLGVIYGFPAISDLLQFTHYETGAQVLFVFGFIGLVTLGGCTVILPRLTQQSWGRNGCSMVLRAITAGTALATVAFMLAGLFQGGQLANPDAAFMASVAEATKLLWIAAAGLVLLLVGAVMFLVGTGMLIGKSIMAAFPVATWFCEPTAEEGTAR